MNEIILIERLLEEYGTAGLIIVILLYIAGKITYKPNKALEDILTNRFDEVKDELSKLQDELKEIKEQNAILKSNINLVIKGIAGITQSLDLYRRKVIITDKSNIKLHSITHEILGEVRDFHSGLTKSFESLDVEELKALTASFNNSINSKTFKIQRALTDLTLASKEKQKIQGEMNNILENVMSESKTNNDY